VEELSQFKTVCLFVTSRIDGPFYGLDPDIPNVSGRPHLYQK